MEDRDNSREQFVTNLAAAIKRINEMKGPSVNGNQFLTEEYLHFFQILIDAVPVPVFFKDARGVYLGCNLAFEQCLGLPREQILGKTGYDLTSRDEADIEYQGEQSLLREGGSQSHESYILSSDGSQREVVFYKKAFSDTNGSIVGLLCVIFDITEQKKAEKALRESRSEAEIRVRVRTAELSKANEDLRAEIAERNKIESELRRYREHLEEIVKERTQALEKEIAERRRAEDEAKALKQQIEFILGATKTGLDIMDSEFNILYIDDEWKKVYGEPAGRKCYEYFMDRHQPCPDCGIVIALQTKKVTVSEQVLVKENNRPIQVITLPFQDQNGAWLIAEVNVDISERKRTEQELRKYQEQLEELVRERTSALEKEIGERKHAEEALQEANNELRAFIASSPLAILILDTQAKVKIWNPAAERMFGWFEEEVRGQPPLYIPDDKKEEFYGLFNKVLQGESHVDLELRRQRRDGSLIYVSLTTTSLYDNANNLVGVMAVLMDITERKQAQLQMEILNKKLSEANKKLEDLALWDSLTGLYNHRYLSEIIEAEIYRARRYASPLSIIMMDIDYFKSINNMYGYMFGDLVLKQLARFIKRMVRRYDVTIRFGGEEFVIISPGADKATALILAQRLLESINLYNFGEKKHTVKLKLSMAVASYPDDKVVKGMDLIKVAEQILNKVKEQGGNNVYSSLDLKRTRASIAEAAKSKESVKFLKERIDRLSRRAKQSLTEAVFAFAKTIEVKDHYTGEHTEMTVRYAAEIARALNLPLEEIERIKQAAVLHDLGKIGISEKILNKKKSLTDKERREIKKHPQIGADIIRPIQFLNHIIPLLLYHHERWDGKGYPNGLKGEEIPVGARIVALADVYQALTSHRPYRKAYSRKEAIEIIKKGAGIQFDPQVVNAFLKILRKEK